MSRPLPQWKTTNSSFNWKQQRKARKMKGASRAASQHIQQFLSRVQQLSHSIEICANFSVTGSLTRTSLPFLHIVRVISGCSRKVQSPRSIALSIAFAFHAAEVLLPGGTDPHFETDRSVANRNFTVSSKAIGGLGWQPG